MHMIRAMNGFQNAVMFESFFNLCEVYAKKGDGITYFDGKDTPPHVSKKVYKKIKKLVPQ